MKYTVKPLCNIAAAAVTMVQQNAAYVVGALHPFRKSSLFLAKSSLCMTLTAPRSKHENGECSTGIAKALSADTKVTLDDIRLTTILHAPTTLGLLQSLKAMVLGLHLLPVSWQPQHNHR